MTDGGSGPRSGGALQRFVLAQDTDGTYAAALAELRAGRKTTHWIWFVFPQLAGLGRSDTSQRYGITSLAEARAYLAHPVLGPRLLECVTVLLEQPADRTVVALLGDDAVKLRSSMTLFARAAPTERAFRRVLGRYFRGEPDRLTERLLAGRAPHPS